MATNKRKDATALFELIEKSTLKVPKRTGSLKIPSWWSSKTNPPGTGESRAGAGANGAGDAAGVARGAAAKPAAPQVKQETPAQRRLYEPPAASDPAAVSPSIRPPVPIAPLSGDQAAALDYSRAQKQDHGDAPPATPAGQNGESASGASAETDAAAGRAEGSIADAKSPAREGYAGTGAGRRVFAPQTMSQDGVMPTEWAMAQKFRLARTPRWMLVSAAGVLAVLVFGLIFLLRPHGGPKTSEGSTPAAVETYGGAHPLIRAPEATAPATAARPAQTRSLLDPVKEPPASAKAAAAQWFGPGAVTRSPTLYYIVIATSPSEKISQRNAGLLADHGVSVSVEALKSQPFFRLISVDGFKTISDAQALRKQIVAIGHLVDNYAKTHKGWDDAMVLRGSSLPGNVAKN